MSQQLLIDVLARAISRYGSGQDERQVRAAIAAAHDAGHTWFHGGKAGLAAGGLILPAAETGVRTLGEITKELDPVMWPLLPFWHGSRTDRVFFGTADAALSYAGMFTLNPWQPGCGSLYAVEPVGESEPDPSPTDLGARCAARAVVTRVVIPSVTRGYLMASGDAETLRYRMLERWLTEMYKSRFSGGLPASGHAARMEAARIRLVRDANAGVTLDFLEAAARQLGAWQP